MEEMIEVNERLQEELLTYINTMQHAGKVPGQLTDAIQALAQLQIAWCNLIEQQRIMSIPAWPGSITIGGQEHQLTDDNIKYCDKGTGQTRIGDINLGTTDGNIPFEVTDSTGKPVYFKETDLT